MTKTVTRYTQPCVQTQPGLEFKVAEVELFEDPKGKWVRYDDIKHLLQDEPEEDPVVTCPVCLHGFRLSAQGEIVKDRFK